MKIITLKNSFLSKKCGRCVRGLWILHHPLRSRPSCLKLGNLPVSPDTAEAIKNTSLFFLGHYLLYEESSQGSYLLKKKRRQGLTYNRA